MGDQHDLRSVFGQFATGVTVITCRNSDGAPHGATVNAFTAVSLEPSLCQVTMTRRSKACAYLSGAPFAVNVLASDQIDTAMHFAGRPCVRDPAWAEGPTGPILTGTSATLSCRPWAEYDGGDHVIFIGEIVEAVAHNKPPLIFYRSTFHSLGVPSAHATWAGSADDPEIGWFDAATSFTPLHLPHTV